MTSFNEPGNCLIFVTLTDYGKATIQTLDEEKIDCCLVNPLYDPRDGIVYEISEEFNLLTDLPVTRDMCEYDHGWAIVQLYAGHVEGREPLEGYVIVTMTYMMEDNGLIPIRLMDIPVLVAILERCDYSLQGVVQFITSLKGNLCQGREELSKRH